MKRAPLIIVVAACLVMPRCVGADTVTLGDPQNWGTGWPFTMYFASGDSVGDRYQQVYDSAEFPSIPIIITGITFFPRSGASWREGAYDFSLSVTSSQVNDLDTSNLDNNVGSSQQFFTNDFLSGSIGSTTYTFVGTPYTYDPSAGNLLLDICILPVSGNGSGAFDARRWDEDGCFTTW